jgi:hypothetical protein
MAAVSLWELIAILAGLWFVLVMAFLAGAWWASRKRVTERQQTEFIEAAYAYGRRDERQAWEQTLCIPERPPTTSAWVDIRSGDLHEGERPTPQTPRWIRRQLEDR